MKTFTDQAGAILDQPLEGDGGLRARHDQGRDTRTEAAGRWAQESRRSDDAAPGDDFDAVQVRRGVERGDGGGGTNGDAGRAFDAAAPAGITASAASLAIGLPLIAAGIIGIAEAYEHRAAIWKAMKGATAGRCGQCGGEGRGDGGSPEKCILGWRPPLRSGHSGRRRRCRVGWAARMVHARRCRHEAMPGITPAAFSRAVSRRAERGEIAGFTWAGCRATRRRSRTSWCRSSPKNCFTHCARAAVAAEFMMPYFHTGSGVSGA